ncbi:hypothetical protein LTR08_000734 [Meristemomyces frigidus]|nr:hypothetical protein LTR08_000734 [Meristemomyces frigidus]
MAKEQTLSELSKPADVKTVLAQQDKDFDCTPCRLMGSAAFTGLGIYSYASGMSQLKKRELEILTSGTRFGLGARRASIYVMSASLVGLGVYRLTN